MDHSKQPQTIYVILVPHKEDTVEFLVRALTPEEAVHKAWLIFGAGGGSAPDINTYGVKGHLPEGSTWVKCSAKAQQIINKF